MPAGEDQDVALERPKPRHDPIGPLGDLRDRLAAGTPVAEEFPVGALSMDFRECPPLVMTVVPLEQVRVERRRAGKAGELTGSQRSLQRTREHLIEPQAVESGTKRAGLFLTA